MRLAVDLLGAVTHCRVTLAPLDDHPDPHILGLDPARQDGLLRGLVLGEHADDATIAPRVRAAVAHILGDELIAALIDVAEGSMTRSATRPRPASLA